MLFDIMRNGFEPIQLITGVFASLFVVFCTMPVHEYAHALVATKLGDQTPRLSGRLTLNPMAHISPIGALMIVLCGFGYAKPVNVNPRNFKNDKTGMALTAVAGPIANLIMAFIFVLFGNLSLFLANKSIYSMTAVSYEFVNAVMTFFVYAATININLAVFNLLPIPPLDGSRILQLLIPSKYYYQVMQYERYIILLVFFLIFTGILNRPLALVSGAVFKLFSTVTGLFFNLF